MKCGYCLGKALRFCTQCGVPVCPAHASYTYLGPEFLQKRTFCRRCYNGIRSQIRWQIAAGAVIVLFFVFMLLVAAA